MSTIKTIKIENRNGLELEVLNYGATIKSLKVPNKYGGKTNVVVGLKTPDDYNQSPNKESMLYLGSSIGRVAGRVSKSHIVIEDQEYQIHTKNGIHLHGGESGFDKKYWDVDAIKKGKSSSVTFSYTSKHLEEGYPGNLKIEVTYELHKSNALRITYKAKTDKSTYVNLTNHAYFNLNGKNTITDHKLKVNSSHYLEVDERLMPTGAFVNLEDSRFDFNVKSKIGRTDFNGFDTTFILKKDKAKAVTISAKETGIKMEIFTNQPAIVIYTPKQFPDLPFDANYAGYPSICFETQGFPDAPNHKNFPSILIQPNQKYINQSVFNFELLS